MPAATLALSDQDRATLESWTRASTVSAGQRERALIVLAVADGVGVSGTARVLGLSRPTVIKWRERFVADGVAGLGEKTQIQALDRTQASLPIKKGRGATMTHDYKRNGTTTLFALWTS